MSITRRGNYPSARPPVHASNRAHNATEDEILDEMMVTEEVPKPVGAVTVFALLSHPVLKSLGPFVVFSLIRERKRYEPLVAEKAF